MNYPLISEYIESIRAAEDNFAELNYLRPVLDDVGNPIMSSGNFAVVFKMKDERTGKFHAVKCFLKEQEGRAEAYRMIAEELEFVSSTFLTPIKYLEKELFVDTTSSDETEFPVLLMDWVEGITLDKYIREHIDDQYELSLLAYQFSRLAMWLMPQPFAHGDLKPDNILVREDGTLVLVDYDGMYVPAMKGQKARELGSPDFRHPSRTENDFDEHIDDFSLASILLSLKAISLQPDLLEQYGASDRLLFFVDDYRNLSESKAMDGLKSLMQDAELASLYSLFILALSQNNLSQVSFRLFNLSRPERSQYDEVILSTEVTEEDLANAWTDEYGVKYSKDRKRLLKAPSNITNYHVLDGTIIICNEAFFNIEKGYTIGKYEVEEIYYVSLLESITLPTSIRVIGDLAFADCRLLNSIIIQDGVKSIGKSAFINCKKLSSVIISNGIQTISHSLFKGCDKLISVSIPNSVEVIESAAFYRCKSLVSVVFPDNVKVIGDFAFLGCSMLETISFSKKLNTIGKSSFLSCKNLKTIFIPSNVKEIKESAFKYCTGLNSIIVEKDNRYFDSRYNCNAIIETYSKTLVVACTKTIIPEGVLKIGNESFMSLKDMTSITLPNSTEAIGDYAFAYCEGISSIIIPENIKTIGTAAFYGCKSMGCVTMANNNIILGARVFHECKNLTNIVIPQTNIDRLLLYDYGDKYAELNNSGFSLIPIHTETTDEQLATTWIDEYGVKYSANKKTLLKAPKELLCYSVRKETVIINNQAFEGCDKLSEISLSNNLRVIGSLAFHNCSSLKRIIIPDNIIKIFHAAFWGCRGLIDITISKSLTIIETDVFADCSSLTSIELPNSITKVSYSSFSGCHELSKVIIPDSVLEIGEFAFSSCIKIKEIFIPKSVKIIGNCAFANCESLSSILISDGVSQLGGYLFSGCNSLVSIYIPSSVSQFDGFDPDGWRVGTFDKCDSLRSIFIPKGFLNKFENLLPSHKKLLTEIQYEDRGWHLKDVRYFNLEEIKSVKSTEIVASQYGLSVRFVMNSGGHTYIPLSNESMLTEGGNLDIKTAKLITMSRQGQKDIYRVLE